VKAFDRNKWPSNLRSAISHFYQKRVGIAQFSVQNQRELTETEKCRIAQFTRCALQFVAI
jgi:hypothetical protein